MRTKKETQKLKAELEKRITKNLIDFFGADATIEKIYSQNTGECIPNEFLGDDVLIDIVNKFYAYLDAVKGACEMDLKEEWFSIIIEPNYEGDTDYLVHDTDIVFFSGNASAWDPMSKDELLEHCVSLVDSVLLRAKKYGKLKD